MQLVEVDADNWVQALGVRVDDTELRFVADHQPVILVILAKAHVRSAGFTWTALGLTRPGEDGESLFVSVLAIAHQGRSPIAHLSHLAVDHRVRRKGLGRASVSAALDWARVNLPYCRHIDLTVHPDNVAAQQLYVGLGFEPTGAERHDQPVWRSPALHLLSDDAVSWAEEALAREGQGSIDDVAVHRRQPWSTVAQISTGEHRFWFKESVAAFHHETVIMEQLASARPGHVLAPVALDHERGWLLLPDGGAPATADNLDPIVLTRRFAEIQVATPPLVPALLAGGVPDRRPRELPEVFRTLWQHPESEALVDRCRALEPFVAQWCDELEADGRVALVNPDLRSDHAFAGSPLRIFDWGDSVIGHPFLSTVITSYNLQVAGAIHDRARAALTEPWGVASDDRLVEIGLTLGCLVNADVWLRGPAEARHRYPDHIHLWMGRFVDNAERLLLRRA